MKEEELINVAEAHDPKNVDRLWPVVEAIDKLLRAEKLKNGDRTVVLSLLVKTLFVGQPVEMQSAILSSFTRLATYGTKLGAQLDAFRKVTDALRDGIAEARAEAEQPEKEKLN